MTSNSFKVNFLIAGAQKGGTTALDAYLRKHPQICMASRKEVHYFDDEEIYADNRKLDYSYYHQFFSPSSSDMLLGESTPIYMYWLPAPMRIQQYNPDMKLIISLRNPLDRAFSHWNMARIRGKELRTFWDAIQEESKRLKESTSHQHRVFSYIERGFYYQQLSRVWDYFPRAQTLILRHEELRESPKDALNKVCEFLKIRSYKEVQEKDLHSRPYSSSMSRREWLHLNDLFKPEIHMLESALNWNCSNWLREPDFSTLTCSNS
jgi:hypothetical protein